MAHMVLGLCFGGLVVMNSPVEVLAVSGREFGLRVAVRI